MMAGMNLVDQYVEPGDIQCREIEEGLACHYLHLILVAFV